MASWISDKYGPKLLSKEGEIASESLELGEEDVLGLYFSAHWCPPCRSFTPKLAEFYKMLNAKGGRKFRIIFVSCDRSKEQFVAYYNEMPWHALPFEETDINSKLSAECDVHGIPKLVLYNSKGEKLNVKSDARSLVQTHSDGEGFPWTV